MKFSTKISLKALIRHHFPHIASVPFHMYVGDEIVPFTDFFLRANPSDDFIHLAREVISLCDDHASFLPLVDHCPQFHLLAEAIPGTTPWLKLLWDDSWELPPAAILHALMKRGDVPPYILHNFKTLKENYGGVYPLSWDSDSFQLEVLSKLEQSGLSVTRVEHLPLSRVGDGGVHLRTYLKHEWQSRMAALDSLFRRFPR